jgi:hypothetical protein
MDKESFRKLFIGNVKKAIRNAETIVPKRSDTFEVELHGAGFPGVIMSPDDALEHMYIDESQFYRDIDVGVKSFLKGRWIVFVRISAHSPAKFTDTWNTPVGNGPFKVIEPIRIDVQD